MTKGNKTASYTYDMSGVRSSKTVNGVSYEYTTLSGKITRMTWSGNAVDIVYDDAGRPYILRYTPSGGATQTYYYALNLQGDVVGLMNTSMQMVVKYSYDPWGKLTGTTATSAYVALAQANPLRYRSYCYDIETGFYYLQTRYYDPTIARFINADGYLSTGATGLLSYNMFAYCENNPVMCSDPTGSTSMCFIQPDEDEEDGYELELGAELNLINGQAVCEYANSSFGKTTIAEAGCAVIATYNALNLLGYKYPFNNCLNDFENIGQGHVSSRALGVLPSEIGFILQRYNIPHRGYDGYGKFRRNMKNGDVAIVTFWNEMITIGDVKIPNLFEGAHTVAVLKSAGGYVVYNYAGKISSSKRYTSLKRYIGDGYIYGYILK